MNCVSVSPKVPDYLCLLLLAVQLELIVIMVPTGALRKKKPGKLLSLKTFQVFENTVDNVDTQN